MGFTWWVLPGGFYHFKIPILVEHCKFGKIELERKGLNCAISALICAISALLVRYYCANERIFSIVQ